MDVIMIADKMVNKAFIASKKDRENYEQIE